MSDLNRIPSTGNPSLDAELANARQGFATSRDGTRLHTVTLGDGPLVVLIHGFPDFWFTWRHQLVALAQAGFTACAFDLRGFNLSDRPSADDAYRPPLLIEDVKAVIAASRQEQVAVVGHDWGGFVAWHAAMSLPAVTKLAALNIPHPDLLARAYARDPAQREAGAYARPFQSDSFETRLTPEMLAHWVTDGAARPAYVEAFGRSDQRAMLAYYRVNYPREPYDDLPDAALRTVSVPTLMIYGLKDAFLLPDAIDGTWKLVKAPFHLVTLPDAAHFVHHDAPEPVTRALIDWLR